MSFTVDIHHHMLPDFFWQATNEGDHPVGGIAPPPWSRANTLSFLTPALSSGAQQVVITNPNGETVSLDAAFIAN